MTGRWPANVILSPDMASALDLQSGNRRGFAPQRDLKTTESNYFGADKHPGERDGYGDSGGASRFFLNAGYEPWELDWIYSVGLRPCGTEET